MAAGYPRALSAIGNLTRAAADLAHEMSEFQAIDPDEVLRDVCEAARRVIAIHGRDRDRDRALDKSLADWLRGQDRENQA